ncbi:flavodoxin domain-containing protein [Bacteroides sedimenti]|uniref:Metallo-beta-lactamase/flavodoxin domain-containing protein n=1 Tax=Bacteroides sedimenti TaxID=2136147 RepID=A0ABM8IEM4_9BACE
MKKHIKNNIYWVGKNDWELRRYAGYDYSAYRGTSYNSYLIQEEKTVLIDTVIATFGDEYIKNLAKEVDLSSIDCIICTQSEGDHSGALPKLMNLIPHTPIYCTANGKEVLMGNYHQNWNFVTVKSGDKLPVGNGKEIIFVEFPLNSSPDTMFCYMTEENVLFSNALFGCHLSSELLFNDLVNQCDLNFETIKYYANLMNPHGKVITNTINEYIRKNIPIDVICPSHGIIWRENPLQIVTKYLMWANNYHENQVTIIYDTTYNATRTIAESIADGIYSADHRVDVKLLNASICDRNDLITEVFRSKGVLVGSPCLNHGILPSISCFLDMTKGLKFKDKKAAAFGSYGLKDASVRMIYSKLKESGFEIVMDPISFKWSLTDEALEASKNYGWLFWDLLSRND